MCMRRIGILDNNDTGDSFKQTIHHLPNNIYTYSLHLLHR